MFIFSTSTLIRLLWQLKAVVFLHWCLIHTVLFHSFEFIIWPQLRAEFFHLIKTITDIFNMLKTNMLKMVHCTHQIKNIVYEKMRNAGEISNYSAQL